MKELLYLDTNINQFHGYEQQERFIVQNKPVN